MLPSGFGPKAFPIVVNRYTDYIIAASHSPNIQEHSIVKLFNKVSSALSEDLTDFGEISVVELDWMKRKKNKLHTVIILDENYFKNPETLCSAVGRSVLSLSASVQTTPSAVGV